MFVHAHLAWLAGFPEATDDGLRWWRLDGTAPFLVDGAMIARARRAQRTLVSDHGDALASVVGDVAHWGAAIDAALTAVGRALRAGEAPAPPVEVLATAQRRALRALGAAHPALEAVIDAAAMAMLGRPAELAAALRWIDGHADALVRLVVAEPGPRGVLAVLRMVALVAEHGAPAIEPLLALAAHDAPLPGVALETARAVANRLRTGPQSAPVPSLTPRTTTSTVVDWIARLAAAHPTAQARALSLLALIDLARPLVFAREWWQRLSPQLARMLAIADTGEPGLEYARNHLEVVDAAIKYSPVVFDLVAVFGVIELAAWSGRAASFPALERLLSLVPARLGELARVRLLEELLDDAELHGDRVEVWLWDAVAAELGHDGASPERLLAPWKGAIDASGGCYVQPLRRAIRSRADARRVAAILAACARRVDITYSVVDRAMAFVPVPVAPEVVADMLDAAARLDGYFDTAQVRAAIALGGDAVKELVVALEVVVKLCDELPGRAATEVAALIEHARAGGGTWALRRLLDDKRGRLVAEAAAVAAVVPRKQWPALVRDTRGLRWLDGYPAELRGALTHLAAADPDAEVTARRILRRDLPHPDDAARELAALRAGRRPGKTAAGRLARLERGSKTPGPVRLGRLAAQLERVAAQIAIDRFGAAVTAAATAAIAAACGLPAWPGWPLDRHRVAVLTAITKLTGRPRELALELLKRRAGAPPWDLRDEPRNLAFLAGLRRRGIDPGPWLDDGVRTVTAADGTPLTIGFAGDPLDVFVMGEHFSTCLGSDGVNFFSVVTNAADVNKRVFYARRAEGVVAGRCLFALTDGGRILTFEAYAHDGKLEFAQIVRAHALELAARMGTEVVGSGTVTTLLAHDWYDDGAVDLVARFPALSEGSDFRATLAELPPAELPARLSAVLDHPLDDVILPLVIALPEIQRRPELAVTLGPALLAATAIPDGTMIHAARHALAAGDLALADRLLSGRARPSLMADTPRWLGDLLARVRPSLALSLLRATRERGVRSWRDEPAERVAVAAMAMESLRRPRQAATLYRLAISRGWQSLKDELRPRLAAVEDPSA